MTSSDTARPHSEDTPKTGRPPLFSSPDEMQVKIDDYFSECDKAKKPYTVPGLALALGFSSRTSLHDYSTRNAGHEEFAATIKMAKLRIETQRVEALVQCRGNPAGMIFDLKNNFGWKDQQAVEISGADGGPLQIAAGLVGMPPQPKNMDEWQAWYMQMQAQEGQEVLDVTPAPAPAEVEVDE